MKVLNIDWKKFKEVYFNNKLVIGEVAQTGRAHEDNICCEAEDRDVACSNHAFPTFF